MYKNIPAELQALRQWVCWRIEDRDGTPTKVPLNPINGHRASVNNPLDWNTFDYAVSMADRCDGIGFVFTKSDPYCGVDIDGNTEASLGSRTIETLSSYSETSPSGKGVHIITAARLDGAGRRRNGIELYDQGRFFTFTGKRINNYGIETRQYEISQLYDSLGRKEQLTAEHFADKPETKSDSDIIALANAAYNGAKFRDLWDGNWQIHYGNRSQSEADLALVNIIAFYSDNRAQIARMFRSSALGQRDKAKRSDYVSWMIRRAFDRKPKAVSLDELYNKRLEVLSRLGIAP
jgi:primase-polymerase (primpol)-like protein